MQRKKEVLQYTAPNFETMLRLQTSFISSFIVFHFGLFILIIIWENMKFEGALPLQRGRKNSENERKLKALKLNYTVNKVCLFNEKM